jgi:hypothetical protein
MLQLEDTKLSTDFAYEFFDAHGFCVTLGPWAIK